MCEYLFPSFRVDDSGLLLGVEGVDYDLAGVVGAWCTRHKILCAAVVQSGDRVTCEDGWFGADDACFDDHLREVQVNTSDQMIPVIW